MALLEALDKKNQQLEILQFKIMISHDIEGVLS